MTSKEKPDSKILYGVDGSEAHLVAGHGLGDRRGSREDGVFSTLTMTRSMSLERYGRLEISVGTGVIWIQCWFLSSGSTRACLSCAGTTPLSIDRLHRQQIVGAMRGAKSLSIATSGLGLTRTTWLVPSSAN